MRIKINERYEAEGGQLARCIAAIPKNFDTEGIVIFSGRNTIKKFMFRRHVNSADTQSMKIIVKRYKRPNFFQKIAYTFFRPTKARKAFYNGLELQYRGFNTPESIAYIETKKLGLIDYCYYICREDYSHPIAERLNDRHDFDREMAKEFARFAARLHDSGILHHDLNSTNVLYRESTDDSNAKYSFSLIDNNRMTFYQGEMPSEKECMENLTRFTGRMDLFEYVAEEYCRCRKNSGITKDRLIAQKLLHDKRWRRRKAIVHLRFR